MKHEEGRRKEGRKEGGGEKEKCIYTSKAKQQSCAHHFLCAEREEDISSEVEGGDLLCAAACGGVLPEQLSPGGEQLEGFVCVTQLQLWWVRGGERRKEREGGGREGQWMNGQEG